MEIKEKKVQVNKIILSQPNKEKQKQNIYYLMKNRQLILCHYSDLSCKTDAYGFGETVSCISFDSCVNFTVFLICELEIHATFSKYLPRIIAGFVAFINSANA